MSLLEVNKITPQSGTTLTLGDTGDTINFGSGVLPNFENLTVTGDLTVDTNSLKVDSTNNRVGIGTASPSVALDVVGAITATGNITGTLATASQPNITSVGTLTSATVSGDLTVGTDKLFVDVSASKVGIGTTTLPRTLNINNSSGNASIGLDGTATSNPQIAFKQGGTDKAYLTYWDSSDTLGLTDGSANGLHFKPSSGRVGIGTSSPERTLHLESAAPEIMMKDSDNATYVTMLSNDGVLSFSRNGSESMRITSAGNVGIGTSSPTFSTGTGVHVNSSTSDVRIHLTNSVTGTGTNDGAYIFSGSDSAFGLLQAENADMRLYTNATERMRINGSGDIVFGKTNPAFNNTAGVAIRNYNAIQVERAGAACLDLNRMNTNGSIVIFYRGATNVVGSISADGSSTSYNTSSDYRLKENVVEITGATERLKQLSPKRFNFIADADTTVDGFLAHEVSDIVPEAITGTHNEVQVWEEGEELPEGVSVGDNKLDDEGNTIPVYQGIDQSKLVPLLVATIKELEARIEALENA